MLYILRLFIIYFLFWAAIYILLGKLIFTSER